MILWLLEKTALEQLEAYQSKGTLPTDEQYQSFLAAKDDDEKKHHSVAGITAEIQVDGLLTSKRSFLAMMLGLGGTTYPQLRNAIAEAENDSAVENIVFRFDSPGGEAGADLVETMNAIRNASKPTTAVVGNMAASAAFGLAVQADTVVAQNPMSIVGSVGTVTTRRIDNKLVTITSSDAPLKRPDASTDEGKAAIQKTADEIEAVFVENIAKGRGITADDVTKNFGHGAPVLARDALEKGMIDSIASSGNQQTAETTALTTTEESNGMDLTKLKAEHPDVYRAAMNEGVSAGEKAERDRVNAHLILGKASGDMETAMKAVEAGEPMTETLRAKYQAAGMNKQDQTALVDEDAQVDAATQDTSDDDQDKDDSMDLANAVVALMGGE
jgi:ClpP class serine protease